MWLCTQQGFFSIVRKADNEYHVRARLRADLMKLKKLSPMLEDVQIKKWPEADYRFRIIVDSATLFILFMSLASNINYSNFKSRIGELPDQRGKLPAYHELWHAGLGWQRKAEGGQLQ